MYLARAVGEGGFERLVALKVMHPHLAKDEQFRNMFLDEARLAAGVHHPNVVSTFDVVTGELIESVDLEDAPIPIDMVATPSGAYFATPGLGVTFMQLMCM